METLTNTNVSENVVNKLIDKISDSIEWIATHDTPKRIAVNSFIEEIKKGNFDPIAKAAYISNAKQIIKGYSNQNNIVNEAISFLQNNSKPENLEEDWRNQFMEKSKRISSDDFRLFGG